MTLLNDLLEEAITRCHDLAEESVEAGQEAASLVQTAHDLKEETEGHLQETRQRYEALERKLAEARAERAEIGEGVSAALEKAREQAGEVEQHAADLLEAARHSLDAMQEQRDRLRERFAERIVETQQTVGRLLEQLEDLEAAAGQGVQQAHQACVRLAQQVSETREQLQHRRSLWTLAALHVRSDLHDAVAQLARRQAHTLSLHGARVEAVKRRLAEEHNKAVAALMEALTEDSLDEMGARLQPLFDAAERVEDDWRAATGALDDEYRTVAESLNEVADELGQRVDVAAGIQGELR
jgi:DNA repair exonuclease SbcCD ATPase subunit